MLILDNSLDDDDDVGNDSDDDDDDEDDDDLSNRRSRHIGHLVLTPSQLKVHQIRPPLHFGFPALELGK